MQPRDGVLRFLGAVGLRIGGAFFVAPASTAADPVGPAGVLPRKRRLAQNHSRPAVWRAGCRGWSPFCGAETLALQEGRRSSGVERKRSRLLELHADDLVDVEVVAELFVDVDEPAREVEEQRSDKGEVTSLSSLRNLLKRDDEKKD